MSNCLYCGQALSFLTRMSGETRFCSRRHRDLYRHESGQLALQALLESPAFHSLQAEAKPRLPLAVQPPEPPKPPPPIVWPMADLIWLDLLLVPVDELRKTARDYGPLRPGCQSPRLFVRRLRKRRPELRPSSLLMLEDPMPPAGSLCKPHMVSVAPDFTTQEPFIGALGDALTLGPASAVRSAVLLPVPEAEPASLPNARPVARSVAALPHWFLALGPLADGAGTPAPPETSPASARTDSLPEARLVRLPEAVRQGPMPAKALPLDSIPYSPPAPNLHILTARQPEIRMDGMGESVAASCLKLDLPLPFSSMSGAVARRAAAWPEAGTNSLQRIPQPAASQKGSTVTLASADCVELALPLPVEKAGLRPVFVSGPAAEVQMLQWTCEPRVPGRGARPLSAAVPALAESLPLPAPRLPAAAQACAAARRALSLRPQPAVMEFMADAVEALDMVTADVFGPVIKGIRNAESPLTAIAPPALTGSLGFQARPLQQIPMTEFSFRRVENPDSGLYIPQVRMGMLRPRFSFGPRPAGASSSAARSARLGSVIPISNFRETAPTVREADAASRLRHG